MSIEELREKFESGELPVDSHMALLHVAYVYTETPHLSVLFDTVRDMHERGWTFGHGDLRFNRTLDVFFITQIVTSMYRSTNQGAMLGSDYEPLPFERIYAENSELLQEDVWKQYYSPAFLRQPTSARFYRLPDRRDLPDSDSPCYQPRNKPGDGLRQPYMRIPRWAHHVRRTHLRQPTLPAADINRLALSTLRETLARQEGASAFAYSETQVRFWMGRFPVNEETLWWTEQHWWPNDYGCQVGRGYFDVWGWEKWYSRERWIASVGEGVPYLAPDLDGTRRRSIDGVGQPDGGLGGEIRARGWEPEVGSEEEVAFSAAVAVEETKDLDLASEGVLDRLDYVMRSHIFWALVWTACRQETSEVDLGDLRGRIVAAGRIDESKADEWISQALQVIKPYVQGHEWREFAQDRTKYHQILVENGQLFGRWTTEWVQGMFYFTLEPVRKELYKGVQ